ncbi:MAG: hypothetical protein H0T53_18070 [Herpetosiphonaceae bacterium]|nr:hypothetical protein [Herpetosiphonaceae bacterium]
MRRSLNRPLLAILIIGLLGGLPGRPAYADSVVVGTGTPASCTEATLDAGLALLFPGSSYPGGTLSFDCGPSPHTIVLTTQKFLHNGTVIDGGGLITLSGGNSTRIFWVSQQAQVAIQHITLTRGFAEYGGAIFVEPNWSGAYTALTVDNVQFTLNTSSSFGGAIGAQHANLLISNSAFLDNSAAQTGGGISFNDGALTLRASVVNTNEAFIEGAGLEVWSANPLTIEQSSIVSNVLRGISGGNGGGGMLIKASTGSIHTTSVTNNIARQGGGMYVMGSSTLEISASHISDNVAYDDGGGIYSASGADLTLREVTLDRNVAYASGGGIVNANFLSLQRSTLTNNYGFGGDGGGLLNYGLAEIINSTVSANDAFNGGGIMGLAGSTTNVQSSTIVENTAVEKGGGISIGSSQLIMMNSIIGANIAQGAGDECWFDGATTTIEFSMWTDTSCGAQAVNGNQPLAFIALHPLGMYGGTTESYLPRSYSPAVDAGSCVPGWVDQRGLPRLVGAACDIGSVETGTLWARVFIPTLTR